MGEGGGFILSEGPFQSGGGRGKWRASARKLEEGIGRSRGDFVYLVLLHNMCIFFEVYLLLSSLLDLALYIALYKVSGGGIGGEGVSYLHNIAPQWPVNLAGNRKKIVLPLLLNCRILVVLCRVHS